MFIDLIAVDVFFSEDNLIRNFLSFKSNGHKFRLSSHNAVVSDGSVYFAFDIQVNIVPEDFIVPLTSCAQNIILFISLDGVFGNNGNGSFKTVNLCLSEHFFFVEGNLRVMMLFIVDSVHAGPVTALIVDQNEAFSTLAADVAENIVFTAENIDEALTFIEMVEVSALETR